MLDAFWSEATRSSLGRGGRLIDDRVGPRLDDRLVHRGGLGCSLVAGS
jgi:hypothetical protein